MRMLKNQTADKLAQMRLTAMAKEYARQSETPCVNELDFDTRLGMMVDAQWILRYNNRINRLINNAGFKFAQASFADIDYSAARNLDKTYVARLTDFAFVREAKNIIITGCTGTGKTYLSCAFGVEACRRELSVGYYRVSKLLADLGAAKGDGSYTAFLQKLRKIALLILDDWGLTIMGAAESRLLLAAMDERYAEKSMIISAQLPVAKWHELYEDSTIADAVLDRIVHNSHRFELKGPSLRRQISAE
jgi:DNA replication protein DnaC